jgi:FKBP-type peptidyl-prolyl cis-trans isomerase 2
LQNMLSADDIYRVKGTDYNDFVFVVSDVNEANGTFEIHRSNSSAGYNGEIAGRTLFFEVTIIEVESATS